MENNMKYLLIVRLHLIALSCLTFLACGTAMAQAPVVTAYGEHYGGKVIYHYQVINNSTYEINSVWIGYDTLNDNIRDNDVWELKEYPTGTVDRNTPPASVTSPPGWEAMRISQEEVPGHVINWSVIDDNSPRLLPGQTLGGMSVKLDRTDDKYVMGHAYILFGNRPETDDLTVTMQRLDTTPPNLTVTLTPNILRSNEKLVPITATITVKDDYDPTPEIKLESITPSELSKPSDIREASLGTDDRQFMLKAESKGKNKTGRFYTVIYSATDASGNKATASATVTVSHDERGHDEHGNNDHRDDKDKKDKDEHKRDR
jgi:hypothetical protein